MVTFDEARELVRQLEKPTWVGPGTYWIGTWGREDANDFHVITGAAEDLIDHDPAFTPREAPVWFVDKTTGQVRDAGPYLPGAPVASKIEAMTVVTIAVAVRPAS